jgi:hypothetical protein
MFEELEPADYLLHFLIPLGFKATLVNQGEDDTIDSDIGIDGLTGVVSLAAGETELTVDAGLAEAAFIDLEKYVKQTPQHTGTEGLSPGFWKQSKHFKQWVDYSPCDRLGHVFGVSVPCHMTLLNALKARCGGYYALMRQSVAALLNASHPNIEYAYSVDAVISMVQEAWATGEYEPLKDSLEIENEKGADLSDSGVPSSLYDFGSDADEPPGLVVTVGERVTFTYVVTNTGHVAFHSVSVIDDNGTPNDPEDDFHPEPVAQGCYNIGDHNRNRRLDHGEEWLYLATAVATAGQHQNMAYAIGVLCDGTQQRDQDVAHWFGESPQPCKLQGTVWHDSYHGRCRQVDGIRDDNETGIANAKVNLLDESGTLLDSTETDQSGRYEFYVAAPGIYVVELDPEAFEEGGPLEGWHSTLRDVGTDDSVDSDADPSTKRAAPLAVTCGSDVEIDFGLFSSSIKLVKTGPTTARAGQSIVFHFRLKNTGDVVLHGGAQVYDPMLNPCGEHLVWSGVLEPNETVEFDRRYRSPIWDLGELVNTAVAVGHPIAPDGRSLPAVTDSSAWTVTVKGPCYKAKLTCLLLARIRAFLLESAWTMRSDGRSCFHLSRTHRPCSDVPARGSRRHTPYYVEPARANNGSKHVQTRSRHALYPNGAPAVLFFRVGQVRNATRRPRSSQGRVR